MTKPDAPFTDYDKVAEANHAYAQRFIPSGQPVYPGLIALKSEALLGAPTVASYVALVPGNYLDLQYQAEDGTNQFLRVIYHLQSTSALYCWDGPRNGVVTFTKSRIQGMAVIV